ncbi:hypothetical protein H0H92_002668 [Tricholoma furcatifolium]|nr:hypothetical protein H0H92_002668 [Tricholoma furcatifolium]
MSIFNASRLLGKTVLITGASGGIGAATAILFAKGGANVILVARRAEMLKAVTDACINAHKQSGVQQGGKFATVVLDVSDKAQVATLFDKVPQDLQDIDVLGMEILSSSDLRTVNNAGYVLGVEHVGDIADADIEGMFATNVLGLISMTQLLVRSEQEVIVSNISARLTLNLTEFKAKQAGHVINLGSIAGREAYAGMVETEFSITRFRGDAQAAAKVYEGLEPLTAADIAEEIVWAAARPPHVNIAEVLVFPVNQASAGINYRQPK